MVMNPLFFTDGYKTSHHRQYPEGTTKVYSNFTPRSNSYAPKGCKKIISFGQQMVLKQIHNIFQENFFSKPKDVVCGEMKRELSLYLGMDYDVSHFEALHDLGYLPIKVQSIKEGTLVPMRVPVLTIYNTKPEFFWVTNYLETMLTNLLWKPMTSATIAYQYYNILKKYQLLTDKDNNGAVDFQGHDFSMRGMSSIDSAMLSGLGHVTSFLGTDTLPVIIGAREYYNEEGFVVGSVNATEHSVMCAGSKEGELATFKRLMEIYPEGILSIVSDTWDLWKVITEILPTLKEEIINRKGKIVIRPDSGNPVDIICGFDKPVALYRDPISAKRFNASEEEAKGVIELLWDIFGGTINEQGYKVLDPHIGAIYGDSITIERAEQICERLKAKGFASTNVVLGIGSYTYQMNSRDTFGFAMKATYVEINGVGQNIFKDPVTDDGIKKSAVGLLKVIKDDNGDLHLLDSVTPNEINEGELIPIYVDGVFFNKTSLSEIREVIKENRKINED